MFISLAVLTFCIRAFAAPPAPEFWTKFPHPKRVYVTMDISKLPGLVVGKDVGGHYGSLGYTLQSLSGLAALAAKEGKSDSMVWLNHASNESINMWLATVLKVTNARRIDMPNSLALVREFVKKGVVKGYIVYRADSSKRQMYAKDPEKAPGYDESVNVATSMSPVLRGIIVEESVEPVYRKMGLKRLLDARGKTQEWVFDNYRDRLSRSIVHFADPKMPFCRDYAIATRAISIFGLGSSADRVLQWIEPNSPVLGWNCGDDEFRITEQTSRWAKFQTASNWCINLAVTSVVRAGKDIPWSSLQVNARSHVDPLKLDWRRDVHYTSFIMTDGDNLQWNTGSFFTGSTDFWASPSRTKFPFGWTSCVDATSRVAAPALAYMAKTASKNDNAVLFPGGYFYADRYGNRYTGGTEYLDAHIGQVSDTMHRLGVSVMMTNAPEWESPGSLISYERFAKRIPGLNGILVIQYCPYSAGQGKVRWVTNREGETIPIIPARYGIWEHHSIFKNEGTPAYAASCINNAEHDGPLTSDAYMDWTTVHAWSYFRKADTTGDLWAEDVDQSLSNQPGVTRGVTPVEWCVDRLADHVKVVTPEELVWRTRLHLKTCETLDALARRLEADPGQPSQVSTRARDYRRRLTGRPLETDDARRAAFEDLRAIAGAR